MINRSVLRVFLASPGDLQEERRLALRIVEEENKNHAHHQDYQIELVGWDDTVSQQRRAQAAINRELDTCECFVGMMWQKWGSSPGDENHLYSSGFEEEFRRSVERSSKTGKPDISLLFKSPNKDRLEDPGDEIKKVLAFRQEIIDGKAIFFNEFENNEQFSERFRAVICRFLREHSGENVGFVPQQKKPSEAKSSDSATNGDTSNQLLEPTGKDFLVGVLETKSADKNVDAHEIARFRLLANTTRRNGNDTTTLGTHDCNLMLAEYSEQTLTRQEVHGLIEAGIEHFQSENTPLWCWLTKHSKNWASQVVVRTFSTDDDICENAFKVLAMASVLPSSFKSPLNLEKLREYWLVDEVSNKALASALFYFRRMGIEGDIQYIEPHENSSDNNVSTAAANAKVAILSRFNMRKAFEYISERQDLELSNEVVGPLVDSVVNMETTVLRQCMYNKTIQYRICIANELLRRGEIPRGDIESLINDPNAEIRLVGVRTKTMFEPDTSREEVRKVLIKPKPRYSPSLFSLFGATPVDQEGIEALSKYDQLVAASLDPKKLSEGIDNKFGIKTANLLVWARKNPKKFRERFSQDISDGFVSYANELIELTKEKIGANWTELTFDPMKRELLNYSMRALCETGGKDDVAMIREIVDKHELAYGDHIVQYFSKHGDWEDVGRLLSLVKTPETSALGLLGIRNTSNKDNATARALIKISKNRIGDLFAVKMPTQIRTEVLRAIPSTSLKGFDNQHLSEFLSDESDSVRKMTALRLLLCVPRNRLQDLLTLHRSSEGSTYYNTVFWLDLGVSAPMPLAKTIAKAALAES